MTNLIRLLFAGLLVLAATGCGNPVVPTAGEAGSEGGTVATVAVPDSMTLVEAIGRDADDPHVIPYEKYVLDNGLTVLLHEDDSDPLVHVDVTYHVGSAREEVGKSGFAHFFEHMMFQGSENVADEEHFRIITEAGGTLNGTTNADRTNYYQTAPSNQLEKILWLEADRMGFFLDAVTQQKFEVQRETVKNERGQRVDNRPYGRVFERVGEALYPAGHPYSWTTIGYIEDLDRVGLNDLKEFFLRWYGPNNATLTIGGRFDRQQVLAWVDRYFADIPAGPDVAAPARPSFSLDADRYTSMEDNVALPLLYMAYPTVHLYHDDEAPLDVLMFILGQGQTSLLYKNMVKPGLAVQANANHGCQELACTFTIAAFANSASGASLADLERIARDSLEEFAARGVEEDDLTRVKMTIVSGMIYNLESVAGKVSRLASHQTFTGNPNFTADDIARYENVTRDDVMRVYRKYIVDKPAVILSVVPQGQGDAVAATDNWTMPARELPDYESIADDELDYRRAESGFDRSIVPPAGGNPSAVLPEIWNTRLANGIDVLGALNDETPTVAIRLSIAAGQRHESLDKLGLAALTAAMMNEATTRSTAEELSNELQKLGSSVSFAAGNDETTLTIRALTENLEPTLAIAVERLLHPAFDPDDFERVKSQALQGLRQARKNPAVTAAAVYQRILFGADNSFAYPVAGTEATVDALTIDDVRQFYARHYSPQIARIVAVSDLDRSAMAAKLDVFSGWSGSPVAEAVLQPFPEVDGSKLYLVDQPGAAQSEIRIGKRALTYDATGDYYKATLMNFPLGGAFNSRVNLNLREDKGYTYGARTAFSGNEDYGVYTASAAVRTDATADSIVQFEREIGGFRAGGISENELSFTRRALGQRDARQYETPAQKLGFLSVMQRYGLDPSFVDEQNRILDSIEGEEIDALADKYLDLASMIVVVVGDKATILPDLLELGYDIVELDADGNELGKL